ncbi:hypothetical protein U3516DRAFT_826272 [Neocallimastix sp. 'constans']
MLFNTTRVNSQEFIEYLNTGYINNDDFKTVRNVYSVIFFTSMAFMVVSLVLFYKLRDSYIIRQRNFTLTFIGGICTFIDLFTSILPQLVYIHCLSLVSTSNMLNTLVNLIFLSRSLRVILFYHLNYFKVSTYSNEKLSRRMNCQAQKYVEPNNYLLVISKKINKIISAIIIIPTVISIIMTYALYFSDPKMREECPVMEKQDALINMKQNRAGKLYIVFYVFSTMFMIFNAIFAFLLLFVKDVNKYGVKFECLSISIMVFIINLVNIILQRRASNQEGIFKYNKYPQRVFLDIYEITEGGRTLFCIVLIYMFFVSVSLPVIQYYSAMRTKNAYFQDPMSSLQYFYKVLKTPSLVNELREIAIREFSVENVLFWESYQVLQKMVNRYQIEYKRAKEIGNIESLNQYDFEKYYFQQMQNYSEGSEDNCSCDPNMPIPNELRPYFTQFYNMFVDRNGPSAVNISGKTIKKIYHEMCLFPTVSIFDDAKEEVVSMMYSSIFPILLKRNKKYMSNTLV